MRRSSAQGDDCFHIGLLGDRSGGTDIGRGRVATHLGVDGDIDAGVPQG